MFFLFFVCYYFVCWNILHASYSMIFGPIPVWIKSHLKNHTYHISCKFDLQFKIHIKHSHLNEYVYVQFIRSMQSHHNYVHQIHRALPIGWGIHFIYFLLSFSVNVFCIIEKATIYLIYFLIGTKHKAYTIDGHKKIYDFVTFEMKFLCFRIDWKRAI